MPPKARASASAKRAVARHDPRALKKSVLDQIPVEIWHTILSFAISCILFPYPSDSDRYQRGRDIAAFECRKVADYKVSETIRTKLRLVCRSWDSFLKEHSDRLVHLNRRWPGGYWPPIKRWDRVVRIENSIQYWCDSDCRTPGRCWADARETTPPILSSGEDTTIKEKCLPLVGSRCRTILLPGHYRESIVHLRQNNSVTMIQETADTIEESTLQSLEFSSAYRSLTHLLMQISYLDNPSFHLDLPELTSLELEIGQKKPNPLAGTSGSLRIGHWALPKLRHLHIWPRFTSQGEINTLHQLLQRIGQNVLDFTMDGRFTNKPKSLVPCEFWDWMPRLKHFQTDLVLVGWIGMPLKDIGCDFTIEVGYGICWDSGGSSLADLREKWASGRSRFGKMCITQSWDQLEDTIVLNIDDGELTDANEVEIFDILHQGVSGLEDTNGQMFSSFIMSKLDDRASQRRMFWEELRE